MANCVRRTGREQRLEAPRARTLPPSKLRGRGTGSSAAPTGARSFHSEREWHFMKKEPTGEDARATGRPSRGGRGREPAGSRSWASGAGGPGLGGPAPCAAQSVLPLRVGAAGSSLPFSPRLPAPSKMVSVYKKCALTAFLRISRGLEQRFLSPSVIFQALKITGELRGSRRCPGSCEGGGRDAGAAAGRKSSLLLAPGFT